MMGFSVTAPWAFNWFLDGNENKVDIFIVGTNGNFFLINAHGVLRRMGAVTEIPGTLTYASTILRWFIGDFTLTPQYFESSLSVNCHDSHFHRLPTISLNRVCQ